MIHPQKILKTLDKRAARSLGQNFLVNTHFFEKILKTIDVDEAIIEIGPGLGALTERILGAKLELLCIEKDQVLAKRIESEYGVPVLNEDILKINELDVKYKTLIGNLPFYITTPIIEHIILRLTSIQRAVVGIQKEVAEKLVVPKGNAFAIFLWASGEVKSVAKVKRTNFYPIPEVDVEFIEWIRKPMNAQLNLEKFSLLTKALFWGRRKKFSTALRNNPHLQKTEIGKHWVEALKTKSNELNPYIYLRADALGINDFIDILSILER